MLKRLKKLFGMEGLRWTNYVQDTVIIHLKKDVERKSSLDIRLDKVKTGESTTLKDDSRYFDAIDTTMLNKFPKGIVERTYEFDYHYKIDSHRKLQDYFSKGITLDASDSEMAIALSHYSVWKEIIEKKTPSTLILEDDVDINPYLMKRISHIMDNELPKDYDILYLSYCFSHTPVVKEFSENLEKAERGVWWLSGYIVSYEGAKKLMEGLPIKDAVDVWINHQFHKMNVFLVKGWPIYQTNETKSNNDWSFHNKYYRGTIY